MTVTLIGAGNLATQLGLALHERGIKVTQVYSRTEKSAKTLAEQIGADYTTDAAGIKDGTDFYIYSLKDDALEGVISQTAAYDGIHLHTADFQQKQEGGLQEDTGVRGRMRRGDGTPNQRIS